MISDDYCGHSSTCKCLTKCKDFYVSNQDNKVKVDLTLDKYSKENYVQICGNLYNKNRNPLCGAFVLLYRYTIVEKKLIFCQKTCTDDKGMYKFILPCTSRGKYIIKVQMRKEQFQINDQYEENFCENNCDRPKKNNIFYY